MATVVLTPTAMADLERLIRTHSLSADARARVRRSLQPLESFPLIGAPLPGRWRDYRFVLGPWRWMVVVYSYRQDANLVAIVTVQDARSARSPTAG